MKAFAMFMLCVGWWPIFCVWLLRQHERDLRDFWRLAEARADNDLDRADAGLKDSLAKIRALSSSEERSNG